MLPGPGLGNDALLAHALSQKSLPEGVVDLVRAGVEQVLALQVDLRAAAMLGQPLGEVEIGRTSGKLTQVKVELFLKFRILAGRPISLSQLEERRHQRLGHIHPTIRTEMAPFIREAERIDFK